MRKPWCLIFFSPSFIKYKFDGSLGNMVENHTEGIPEPRKKEREKRKLEGGKQGRERRERAGFCIYILLLFSQLILFSSFCFIIFLGFEWTKFLRI